MCFTDNFVNILNFVLLGPSCPGLDLHFWRKVCRSCHCSKDVHDVQDDDLSGWAQFELLGTAKPKKGTCKYVYCCYYHFNWK